eukprot:TRINITY_DN1788_c0_g1_i1.p1 TRINITY_DN1788_c0_g1~~TRINITY_DN1788_c0_g1_i1.p1  ORF type:complete len:479 (-),score=99.32 TRINITY_DN1788_c0_g1_i1:217-1653(-)
MDTNTRQVTFRWKYGGSNVMLVGDFNQWKPEKMFLDQEWVLTKSLSTGSYNYKFIVDGNWCHDVGETTSVDGNGNVNNHLLVSSPSANQYRKTLVFRWSYGGSQVSLAGTFNDWCPEKMKQGQGEGVWTLDKTLSRGSYEYKFVVDGNWCHDSAQPTISDLKGNKNNVVSIDFTLTTPFWWTLSGKKALVSGTFSHWKQVEMQHIKDQSLKGSKFYTEIALPLGTYQYKYIVDGRWLYDDRQPHDYFDGVLNNYVEVKTGVNQVLYYQYKDVGLKYLAYLPKGYVNADAWPLILYLHSKAEKGDDISVLEKNGIPKVIKDGKDIQAIVISPQLPSSSVTDLKWSLPEIREAVINLLEHFCSSRNVDRSRIYLTGMEMGGYGVWSLASEYPDLFAAIAPYSGGGNRLYASSIKMPVWAFHCNRVIPISETEPMVTAVREAGGRVQYTELGNTDFDKPYGDDELYYWLLSHQKETVENSN